MRRFTIAPERIDGPRVIFDRAETHHLARVLRLRAGDVVVAADGHGREYSVRIEALGDAAVGTVLGMTLSAVESPLAITLIQAVPKGDRMEAIVRDATELGVARVVPALTERTIVRREADAWEERTRRWQRIAREASKQCGRAAIPGVASPRPLADALAEAVGFSVCLWEGETRPLAAVLDTLAATPAAATILIGPEGGLTAGEVEAARRQGFAPARLGPRILRTETAGPAVIAILQSRYGDLR